MEKIGRMISMLTSASMLISGLMAYPVQISSAGDSVMVEIDRVELTIDELTEMNYQVPVSICLSENPGVNVIGFGGIVDERCSFTISYESVPWFSGDDLENSTFWINMASVRPLEYTGTLATLIVTLPDNAAPGDVYSINYLDTLRSFHQWCDVTNDVDYAMLGEVCWTDGYIQIEGEATTTTTLPSQTTTTETTSTTTKTPILIPSSLTMTPGDTNSLIVMNASENAEIQWTSNDTSVAAVENGVVTAVSAGTAVIYALCDGTLLECTVTVKGDSPSSTPGDVNLDTTVSIVDVIYLNKAVMGAESLTESQKKSADCDHDGDATAADSLLILKSLVDLITLS